MTVRKKLLLFISALVVFMAATFFTLSRGYLESLFRQYAAQARQGEAEQYSRYLGYYFDQHGGSWVGVNQYILELVNTSQNAQDLQTLILYDNNGNVIVAVGRSKDRHQHLSGDDATGQTNVPIVVDGQVVGQLRVEDTGGLYAVERTIQQSMTTASALGALITVVVALAAGFWFSRRLTTPLRQLLTGIRNITAGKLQTTLDIGSNDELGEVGQAFNEMSRQLARTEESRRHLVADVSHELRIPLTIMKGQLELIQQGVKKADPETLLPIQDEVMRLTRLVQDLHQLSLAEVGKLPLERTPTDLNGLLERILHIFEVETEDRGLQITLASDLEDGVQAWIDPDRITQVFVNLLGNAVRYIPDGGQILVRLTREGKQIRCTVQDTGPGIAPDHLEHIFDRFYRADEDRSRETGGTGLGLAIAKEYVESHDGRIEAHSIVGQGTTFDIWLPIADKPA